jgi:hypothetical protein
LRHGRPLTNADLVRYLCAASAALREASRLHQWHFGTLIPHVFMGDVLTRVGYCVSDDRGASARHQAEAAMILEVLEQGLEEGERETRNVIALSFVNDSELERFFYRLRPLMGPRMLGQLRGK